MTGLYVAPSVGQGRESDHVHVLVVHKAHQDVKAQLPGLSSV